MTWQRHNRCGHKTAFTPVAATSLSLIVLIANIAAPFRTSAGRTPLTFHGQRGSSQSVARVRATSQIGASHGFRAVVGLPEGGSGEASLPAESPLFPATSLPSPIAGRSTQHEPSAPIPALRFDVERPSLDNALLFDEHNLIFITFSISPDGLPPGPARDRASPFRDRLLPCVLSSGTHAP